MSDKRPLVDRLRDCAGAWADFDYDADADVCFEAANKIEELEAEGNRQADNMLKLLAKIQELEALNRNQRNHLHEAHREIVKLKA